MSQAIRPVLPVTYYQPVDGDPHGPHPMAQLPAGESQPFILNFDPGSISYRIGFRDNLTQQQDPSEVGVRIFILAFHDATPSVPIWRNSFPLAKEGTNLQTLPLAGQNVPTSFLVGAWWNNGDFRSDEQGVSDYFAHHPVGGVHHTVPIRIG